MPQMVVWPFMRRTMVEAGISVKTADSGAPAPLRPSRYRDGDIASPTGPLQKFFEILPPRAKLAEGLAQGPVLFGWGRKAAIEERAQKVARMLFFIKHSMRTRSYDQFVASFSNPGDQPDVLQRYDRKAHFTMHVSASCWYSATVSFPHDPGGTGTITLQGGGDDFGVFITAADDDDLVSVALHLAIDQKAGRDGKSMVRTLEAMPNWTRAEEMERNPGIEL